MPFNAVGVYSLPQPLFVAGTVISSSNVNSDLSDIASALTTLCVTGALSVRGRASNSIGPLADISATAASAAVLRESGSTIGFGTVATAGIADAAVTLAKMENRAQATVIGRQASAGTGVPQELSATNLMSVLASVTRYKVGSTTRDMTTASGTQAVTGIGFQPSAVALITTSANGAITSSIGYYGTSITFSAIRFESDLLQAFTSAGNIVSENGVSTGNYQTAAISSFDSGGFTLSWTKTGSPTGTATVVYFAIR